MVISFDSGVIGRNEIRNAYRVNKIQFLITLVIVFAVIVGSNVSAYMIDYGTQTVFYSIITWIGKYSLYPAFLLLKMQPVVYPNIWIYIALTLLNSLVYSCLTWALYIALNVKFKSGIKSAASQTGLTTGCQF